MDILETIAQIEDKQLLRQISSLLRSKLEYTETPYTDSQLLDYINSLRYVSFDPDDLSHVGYKLEFNKMQRRGDVVKVFFDNLDNLYVRAASNFLSLVLLSEDTDDLLPYREKLNTLLATDSYQEVLAIIELWMKEDPHYDYNFLLTATPSNSDCFDWCLDLHKDWSEALRELDE